jgi:subtilisin family serine protease
VILLVVAFLVAACSNLQSGLDEVDSLAKRGGAADYIISSNRPLSRDLATTAARSGDRIKFLNEGAGVAVVRTSNPNAYSRFANNIVRDINLQWIDPERRVVTANVGNPPNSGVSDAFFDLQWGHTAVDAPAAWNAGVRGKGARVAVLDTGFDLTHPDLVPNIDFEASADMTGEGLQYTLNTPFSHGTHVAGTIAAAQNGVGVIGVAPEATLILVKVLRDVGSGSFADVMAGIVHAADVGADVINMSLGATISRRSFVDEDGNRVSAKEANQLLAAMNQVMSYAHRKGATIISSAGNDARNSNEMADQVNVPAYSPHVLAISATAPIGWATDPENTNLDNLASYSHYGLSRIDFAAPGGDFVYPGNESCTVAGLTRSCWVFDLVFSTGAQNAYYWSAGTSMASPHAAGVAALIISENGGSMKPAQVRAELAKRADDLGKPGKDEIYGHGRVNSSY